MKQEMETKNTQTEPCFVENNNNDNNNYNSINNIENEEPKKSKSCLKKWQY